MEIEGEDGSRIEIRAASEAVLGRGSGLRTADRTVSRRHVLFKADDPGTAPLGLRVYFEVLGKNPVWVRRGGGGEIRAYRRSEKGEMAAGDLLCVSGKRPVWFAVMGVDRGRDLGSESEVEAESSCVPEIGVDPVTDFSFLVMGHEFDQYPKQMWRNVKDWNWFLDEPSKDNSEDEHEKKKLKPSKTKKRKEVKGLDDDDDDDEDWTGKSEEEKQDLMRPVKVRKQDYFTRSKDNKVLPKRTKGGDVKSVQKKRASGSGDGYGVEDYEQEQEDETLGGFIVTDDDDDDVEREKESEADEEEEEFIEDDEED